MIFKKVFNGKAFTLLELILVVVIVGVLAAVAMPRLGQAVEKFRAQEAIHAIEVIAGAQERYYIDNGQYYTGANIDGLDVEISSFRHFELPDNSASAINNWLVSIDRSDGSYRVWTSAARGPENMHCMETSGGPNAQDICNIIGLIYGTPLSPWFGP